MPFGAGLTSIPICFPVSTLKANFISEDNKVLALFAEMNGLYRFCQ